MGRIVADDLNSPHMASSDAISPSLLFTLLFAFALVRACCSNCGSLRGKYATWHGTATLFRAICRAHHPGCSPKAADYTVAKARLELLELALGTAVLLGWTLLGGLNLLNQALLHWLGGGMWQQLALLAAFVLISGLIDLPVSLYKTFVQEKRFGFNKMTLALWFADLYKSMLLGAAIGLPIAAAILWLMGQAGTLLMGLGLGRLDGVQPAADGDFPPPSSPHCSTNSSHWKTKPSNNACRI